MKKEIPKQLCLIKDVFLHGEQHAFFGSKLDKRLAIISFHNSIELFLRYALNSKSISNDELEGMKFKNKIDEFGKRLLQNETISNKAKIMDLNNLRNKIYHAYLEPRDEEINEAKVITKLFLEEYTKTIFNLNFNTISSFELEAIRNPFVKDAYIEATEFFGQGKYKNSMLKFQHAFNEQWKSVYGTPITVRTKTDIYNIPNIDIYEDIARDVKILADCINEILKRTHIKKNHFYLKK